MHAKLVDGGTLACTRHATDAHTYTIATVWQALIDHLLRLRLMVGIDTLDEGYGL